MLLDGQCGRIDSRDGSGCDDLHRVWCHRWRISKGQANDSITDVTLPADGLYFIKVHDALFAQGSGYIYRLTVGSLPYLDFVLPPASLPGSNEEFTIYGRDLPEVSRHRISWMVVRWSNWR